MSKKEGKPISLSPAWWIAYGILIGLVSSGLILLLAAPRRGQPIQLIPAPTHSTTTAELGSMMQVDPTNSPTDTPIPTPAFPLNINTATADELDQLPGIGPTLALAILAYRDTHGPFTSIEDIKNVPDIGPRTYEAIAPFITVSGP